MHRFRAFVIGSIAIASLGLAFPAQAAGLTDTQIQAILSLLSSFGADSSTIANVNASLHGQAGSSAAPATTPNDNENSGVSGVSTCPALTRTLSRGATDITTNGEVSALQSFLTDYYNLGDPITSGYFGVLTEKYVRQFQAQQGIDQVGFAGQLTRAAVARACAHTTPGQPNPPTTQSSPNTTVLTPAQIQVAALSNVSVTVGTKITITYIVGEHVAFGDPAIVERSIINANTEAQVSGYIPVTESAGSYSFDWTPSMPGTYRALVKISKNTTQYAARSAVITVTSIPVGDTTLQTPFITFDATPLTLGTEGSALLRWNVINANRCVLQTGSTEEVVGLSSTKSVAPSQTTSYRLACTNDPGTGKDGPSAEKTVTISVVPPTCSLTADKSAYTYGEPITLTWVGQSATYAAFWQDTSGKDHLIVPGDKLFVSGTQKTIASVMGNPSVKLLVYNYLGNGSCSVTVSVTQ